MALGLASHLKKRVRRRVVRGLRWLVGQLREEVELAAGDVSGDATGGVPTSPDPSGHGSAPTGAPLDVPVDDSGDALQSSATTGLVDDDRQETAAAGFVPPVDEPASDALSLDGTPSESQSETYQDVIDALQTIYDPEIPVDIYELGLIYSVDIRDDRTVAVQMTLTTPNCPAAQSLPEEVRVKVTSVKDIDDADVEVVFDPPWSPDMMSEEARLMLNV
jgi:FeS assembly SUF system protein